jgi:hypothetical protein
VRRHKNQKKSERRFSTGLALGKTMEKPKCSGHSGTGTLLIAGGALAPVAQANHVHLDRDGCHLDANR